MVWVLIWATLWGQFDDRPLRSEEPESLRLEEEASFVFESTRSGQLLVWAIAEGATASVTIQPGEGSAKQGSAPAPGRSVLIRSDVGSGNRARLTLTVDAPADARIQASLCPDTEATRSAAAEAAELLDSIEASGRDGLSDHERRDLDALATRLLRTPGLETSFRLQEQLDRVAATLDRIGAYDRTIPLWQQRLFFCDRFYPADHPEIERICLNLGALYDRTEQLDAAAQLSRRAVQLREAHLPEGDQRIQDARWNLAGTLRKQGDLQGAREVIETFIATAIQSLGESHPEVQLGRRVLADICRDGGDLDSSRKHLLQALGVEQSRQPANDLAIARLRLRLAMTDREAGHTEKAVEYARAAIETFEGQLPAGHVDRASALSELAVALKAQGRQAEAFRIEEQNLEETVESQGEAAPASLMAMQHLAQSLTNAGELDRAYPLLRRVLAIREQQLPPNHAELASPLLGLAYVLHAMNDLESARELQARALEILTTAVSESHLAVQTARTNLGLTLVQLGRPEEAQALMKAALEELSAQLPPEDLRLCRVRGNLALCEMQLGNLEEATRLRQTTLDSFLDRLPPTHSLVQIARFELAESLVAAGEVERALELQRAALAVRESTLSSGHRLLQSSRRRLIESARRLGELDEARSVATRLAEDTLLRLEQVIASGAPRELELARREAWKDIASWLTVWTLPLSDAQAETLFSLVETTRSADLRFGLGSLDLGEEERAQRESLRADLARLKSRMIALIRERSSRVDVLSMRRDIESIQFELAALERGARPTKPIHLPELRDRLQADEVACLYFGLPGMEKESESRLVAMRVTPKKLDVVDLGLRDSARDLVEQWRSDIIERREARESGRALRARVLDPVLEGLQDVTRVYVASDDALSLIAFDALPQGDGFTGDRLGFRNVAGILPQVPRSAATFEPRLLAIGGVDYGGLEIVAAPADDRDVPPARMEPAAFSSLPNTRIEVESIAAIARKSGIEAHVLLGSTASRDAFEQGATRASFIHLATHGYYNPESVREDPGRRGLDGTADLSAPSLRESVSNFAPGALCGLALARANAFLSEPSTVLTAEELEAIDLSHCELITLSACETHLGQIDRASLGTATLAQAALAAGAGSVITSLWKVPDDVTAELMTELYQELWVKGRSPAEALWTAKKRLRERSGQNGHPVLQERDWAGWVLTSTL